MLWACDPPGEGALQFWTVPVCWPSHTPCLCGPSSCSLPSGPAHGVGVKLLRWWRAGSLPHGPLVALAPGSPWPQVVMVPGQGQQRQPSAREPGEESPLWPHTIRLAKGQGPTHQVRLVAAVQRPCGVTPSASQVGACSGSWDPLAPSTSAPRPPCS